MTCEDTSTHNSYNYIGLIGSLILSFSIIPQVYKTFMSKSAEDLSYKWLFATVIGLSLVNIIRSLLLTICSLKLKSLMVMRFV